MQNVFYEGDRIYFRALEPGDEPTLRRWINDPRLWSTLNHHRPINETMERDWLERVGKQENDYVFGIVVKEGDRHIGTAGLHNISRVNRSATFGIMIGDVDSQNQKFGSEAVRLTAKFGFAELNLHRIELHVFDFNPRAIHVYEKAGYQYEGRLRQAVYRHGQYRDVLVYSLLRSEWEAAQTVNQNQTTPAAAGS